MGSPSLSFTPAGDGREEVRRRPDEAPFAVLDAPRRTGTRKWGVKYRDGQKPADPFHSPTYNVSPKNRAAAVAELEHSARVCNDAQLGLLPVDAKAFCQLVHDRLGAAGLPRTSTLAGGSITGWTDAIGSTGFSVNRTDPREKGWLRLHFVISGKVAGLRYRTWKEVDPSDDDVIQLHEPVDPERLFPRIKDVLRGLGLVVHDVRFGGAQTHWDDDVEYDATISDPGLTPPPPKSKPRHSRYPANSWGY